MTILTVGDCAGLPTNYIFSFRGSALVITFVTRNGIPTQEAVLETAPTVYVLGPFDYTTKFHGSDLTYDDAGGWSPAGKPRDRAVPMATSPTSQRTARSSRRKASPFPPRRWRRG